MWCLEVHQVRYLRNGLRKCNLSVDYRRPHKVGCRSNSLCFFVTHTPTHLSIELYTFRCLVGHVFQRSGPVGLNVCGLMVNMPQVMISPDFICKIHILGLPVLHRNERCCNCNHTELLSFWNLNPGTPLSSPLQIPISPSRKFFVFPFLHSPNLQIL